MRSTVRLVQKIYWSNSFTINENALTEFTKKWLWHLTVFWINQWTMYWHAMACTDVLLCGWHSKLTSKSILNWWHCSSVPLWPRWFWRTNFGPKFRTHLVGSKLDSSKASKWTVLLIWPTDRLLSVLRGVLFRGLPTCSLHTHSRNLRF